MVSLLPSPPLRLPQHTLITPSSFPEQKRGSYNYYGSPQLSRMARCWMPPPPIQESFPRTLRAGDSPPFQTHFRYYEYLQDFNFENPNNRTQSRSQFRYEKALFLDKDFYTPPPPIFLPVTPSSTLSRRYPRLNYSVVEKTPSSYLKTSLRPLLP